MRRVALLAQDVLTCPRPSVDETGLLLFPTADTISVFEGPRDQTSLIAT